MKQKSRGQQIAEELESWYDESTTMQVVSLHDCESAIDAAIAEEREACAKFVESDNPLRGEFISFDNTPPNQMGRVVRKAVADIIRARSNP